MRLRARGGRNALEGFREGRLQAKVAAAPVDGRANAALCKLIAKRLGVARSTVTIASGERSRDKVVSVEGVDAERLKRELAG